MRSRCCRMRVSVFQAPEAGSCFEKMNLEFLEKLLAADAKTKVVSQFNKERIGFFNLQTSMMGEVFSTFPEVILMIRFQAPEQRTLYVFLADGPRVGPPYEATRMVHVAMPINETPSGLSHMFRIMRDLNPFWVSIRVFLVEPGFTELSAIQKVFPSVEVMLSAYHVYAHIHRHIHQHIHRRIHGLQLPDIAEFELLDALNNTMCSATERNLKNLHSILQRFEAPVALYQMNPDWLLMDRIWALHRWRTWEECTAYFQMVESFTCGLNAVFNISQCLTETMDAFISFILEQTAGKSQPLPRSCSPEELSLIKCKGGATKRVDMEAQMEPEAAALMCETLHDICNPAAFRLCQNELEVAQKSVDLVGTIGDKAFVQILENPNKVSFGKRKNCTCGFYRTTELPCRHILSALSAGEENLQPNMLHPHWQKQTDGAESELPVSSDTLEILKGEGSGLTEKHLLVNSLTDQMSALLAECSDEIFESRYNTLRELADAWIGPYDQVKL